MNRIAIPILGFVTLLAVGNITNASMPSFQGLGSYGNTIPLPHKISADGNVIIGRPQSTSGAARPFVWCYGLWHPIDASFAPDISFYTNGISADGSVIVGHGHDTSTDYWGAYRLADGGITPLEVPGFDFAVANDVNGDGSIIVGYASRSTPINEKRAVRWDNGVPSLLPIGSDGTIPHEARAISTDGSTIVGEAIIPGIASQAFRWSIVDGVIPFRTTQPEYEESHAWGVSANGEYVVGVDEFAAGFGYTSFRWGPDEVIDMGIAPFAAQDVSADGSIIVGGTYLWQDGIGLRLLQEFLMTDYGLDTSGWTNLAAGSISDDGMVIVGSGTNPNGVREGWIATIPEPASLALFLIGSAFAGLRRPAFGGN
ncbi:MAG: PEP-CTERM sorting domain-containing protein [Phycisphaerales bacterium]|nr:PEP-CTERM sorting domain-containing protein [Phycisphaerales bacterium]MCB9857138.1 PEP-CTERM sorting domain-containing protein [Phycisphaerales bacterium]MCB9861735.1 PEP-CTERM sorting domain-containing protein [Phycisphaerales bacterium]